MHSSTLFCYGVYKHLVLYFFFLSVYYEVLNDMEQEGKFHTTTITILKYNTPPPVAHVSTNTHQVTNIKTGENRSLLPFFFLFLQK